MKHHENTWKRKNTRLKNMIILHIAISALFFVIGFIMRYGLSSDLAKFFYNRIPMLLKEEYDEIRVRRFVGETSIKLGCFIFIIAMVGIIQPRNFNIAMIIGWICIVILAVGSVTFFEKINIFKKIKPSQLLKK